MAPRHVIITGGFGFVGQELCKALLKAGQLGGDEITKVVIVDVFNPEPKPAFCSDRRVETVIASLVDAKFCEELMPAGVALSVFHMAGIMSGEGEKDFDLCLSVNLDSTRNLLQAARKAAANSDSKPRFVFCSTGAVFGETDDCPVGDTTKLVPKNTYGMTKAVCELLINDFTRKGFLDGRSARLPTVVVRPGKPNAATTSCFSGVIREPLHGVDCALPVKRNLPHSVCSVHSIVGGLIALHDVKWPEGLIDRGVNMPSISITLQDLVDALYRVVAKEDHGKLGKITDAVDPFLNGVVASMAVTHMGRDRAVKLGLPLPEDLDTMVRDFITDFGENVKVRVEPPAKKART